MHFIKIETNDNETRWIHLEQVSRVTVATQTRGTPILAIFFSDGNRDSSLKIDGSNVVNQKAIDLVLSHLEALKK